MDKKLLIEKLNAESSNIIIEQKEGKDLYLTGISMQAELENGNGRNYPLDEIENAVKQIQESIDAGNFIAGELNHPDHLSIDLERVSHIITEVWMDGNNAMCKMKVLDTPMGSIVKKLVEGGFRPGVSSRGTGHVNEGVVQGFDFLTLDIVATPSAPDAYPTAIRESFERLSALDAELANVSTEQSLTEAVQKDDKSQEMLVTALTGFISDLVK